MFEVFIFIYRFTFICNKWLSLDHDDGQIECAFPVSSKSEVRKAAFLFNENSRENVTDGHLWLSVAMRPEECDFTRVQRLACCLTLLFLTMISNAMFYGQDRGRKMSIGPIHLSTTGLYISLISALIAAPPTLIITYLFRNSRRRKRKITDKQATINKEYQPLPFGCKLVAWSLVCIAVLVSGFFLILYSMEWGKTKSEEWLLCFVLSFVQSMFVIDPLKVNI